MTGVTIDLSQSPEFSPQATRELESIIGSYSLSIVGECNRLATAEALSGNSPEITAAIVRKANDVFKLSNDIKLLKRPPIWLRIASSVAPVVTGLYPNIANMDNKANDVIMVVLLLISTALIVAVTLKDYSK